MTQAYRFEQHFHLLRRELAGSLNLPCMHLNYNLSVGLNIARYNIHLPPQLQF